MYYTPNAYSFGYVMGTLLGVAIIAAVVYILPMIMASVLFKLKKLQVLGVIMMAYAVIGFLMSLIGVIIPNGGNLAPFGFLAIFNLIGVLIVWIKEEGFMRNGGKYKG